MTRKVTVFVFDTHRPVLDAVKALKNAGCDLRKLSVVGKDCCGADHSLNYCSDTASQKSLADLISFWHKMWGMLSGDAFLTISEIGPILVAGPLAQPLVAAWTDLQFLEELSPLRASLRSYRLPMSRISEYEVALNEGRYLVLVHGDSVEVTKAIEILHAALSGTQSRPRKPPLFVDGLAAETQRA